MNLYFEFEMFSTMSKSTDKLYNCTVPIL